MTLPNFLFFIILPNCHLISCTKIFSHRLCSQESEKHFLQIGMEDHCMARLIRLSPLQIQPEAFLLPFLDTLEAPLLCVANLFYLNPTAKLHISSSYDMPPCVSIIVAVMQRLGKTHKCQILFNQSGYVSEALCGLSLSRVLRGEFLKTFAFCFS